VQPKRAHSFLFQEPRDGGDAVDFSIENFVIAWNE